jgi:hypothetical protein
MRRAPFKYTRLFALVWTAAVFSAGWAVAHIEIVFH